MIGLGYDGDAPVRSFGGGADDGESFRLGEFVILARIRRQTDAGDSEGDGGFDLAGELFVDDGFGFVEGVL